MVFEVEKEKEIMNNDGMLHEFKMIIFIGRTAVMTQLHIELMQTGSIHNYRG